MKFSFPKNLKHGMTMVEIVVVMIIFIVIASIGFQAINNFKVGSELASGSAQFENMVKTVQNNARNNVVSRANPDLNTTDPTAASELIFNSQIHGYLIYLSSNTFEVRSCKKLTSVGVEGWYDCSTVEPMQSTSVVNVNISSPGSSGGSVLCNGIFYENKTGRMRILTGISSSSSLSSINPSSNLTASECDIEVSHIQKGSSGKVHNYKFNTNGNLFTKVN